MTYLVDITEYVLVKVDVILDNPFKGIVFIVVLTSFVSAQVTKCFRKALRVSVEVRERRGAFLFKI